jgi:hypothetical protein
VLCFNSYENKSNYPKLYAALGKALNETGRPIVYACSWVWFNFVFVGI